MTRLDRQQTVDGEIALRFLEMLVEGLPPAAIVERIERAGLGSPEVIASVRLLGLELRESAKRLEACKKHAYWMAGIRRRLGSERRDISRVKHIDSKSFYRDYYSQNRPLFFESGNASLASFSWSFSRIRRDLGAHVIEIMRNRIAGKPDFFDSHEHKTQVTLAEFVDEIQSVETNEVYLTAFNRAAQGGLHKVLEDFFPLDDILDRGEATNSRSLWMGPKGASSPLHYDRANVVIVQLLGTKRVTLFSPEQKPFLYDDETTLTSPLNPRAPDLGKFPLFRFAGPSEVLLSEGSALFVPVGWWHFVESLKPSLSVSMTNFRVPNFFPASLF